MSIPEGFYHIISVSSKYPNPPENPSFVVKKQDDHPLAVSDASGIASSAIWFLTASAADPANGVFEIRNGLDPSYQWGINSQELRPHAFVVASKYADTLWKVEAEPAHGGFIATIRPNGPKPPDMDVHVGLHQDQLQIHFVPPDFQGDKAKWFIRPALLE
jgi:hypothetical protein